MTTVNVAADGTLVLPKDVRERYGLKSNVTLSLLETRGGILLVPGDSATMSEELIRELEDWQRLGADSWAMFPYEENQP